MSDGFPKESSSAVGRVGVLTQDNVEPSTDVVEVTLPGICISTAVGTPTTTEKRE